MAKFKIVLSDPETGESKIAELDGSRAVPLIGRKLGETIDGAAVGLGGHKLKITGGSDKDGFPLRPDIHGGVKTQIIISSGVGFHSTHKGARRRKTVRGSVITEDTVQINMKITEKPKKTEKAGAKKEEKPKKAEVPDSPTPKEPTEEGPKEHEEETKESKSKTGGQQSEENAQTA
jgi:small subunit ribosomal protein S6e